MLHSNATIKANMGFNDLSALESENEKLRKRVAELELLVATDTLTPLFNRRYFMKELDRWCWRAQRYDRSFGLLFCDVDRFKSVNDVQGHNVGDTLLQSVAATLLGAVRKSDIVSRIGGDEFTVLLDSIAPVQLIEKTQAMQIALADLQIMVSGAELNFSVSVGSALISAGSTPSDVLEQADQQMYIHKRSKYSATGQ
jgi:diguanylate cyclase (GGDEF)-like protein